MIYFCMEPQYYCTSKCSNKQKLVKKQKKIGIVPIGIERKKRIYYFHCFRISDCAGMEKRNGNLWVYHKLQRGDICKEHYPDVLVRCLGGDPVILFYYFFLLSSHRLKEGLENTNYEQTYEFIVLFTGEPFCIFTSYFTPICLF